ncbi:MAG: 50S ribosomal protein L6 [Abditibacteriales bacterium]|nr:50S ribosomal protein L6 [Abditibacteriales bacterium]MDW8364995.1 50S ribosomal protein L6 [Abditibacteriales bacterium]
MSRVGKLPIPVPPEVTVDIQDHHITVRGPKGTLERDIHPDITVRKNNGALVVERPTDSGRHKALHGLTRALVANMVKGVTEGFQKGLEVRGVGYRAEVRGNKLVMQVGYSHPVELEIPPGLSVEVQTFTPTQENKFLSARLTVRGADKQRLGDWCAEVRRARPADPYKGKGIRYTTEVIHLKPGKTAKSGERK